MSLSKPSSNFKTNQAKMYARKSRINSMSMPVCGLLKALAGLMVLALACHAVGAMQLSEADQRSAPAVSLALVENPEITARILESLLRSVVYSTATEAQPFTNGAQKRGLDLGISRGFSGSQAGKHLMGLSAASFANGPGKR